MLLEEKLPNFIQGHFLGKFFFLSIRSTVATESYSAIIFRLRGPVLLKHFGQMYISL